MRYIQLSTLILFFILAGCKKNTSNKYDTLNGNVKVTGSALLTFPGSSSLPSPLANVQILLSNGNDTSNYIYQTITDSTGRYSIPLLKKEYTYTVFTRFIRNGIPYTGAATFKPYGDIIVDLKISPQFTNGLVITIKDSLGGNAPRIHLRLYTSKLSAIADYTKNAVTDTVTDVNGQYIKYNATALTYYVVIKDSIEKLNYKVLDSVNVGATGIAEKTIYLSPSTQKNGLKLTTTDAGGNKIEGVNVNIYDNYDVFKTDSAANTITAALNHFTTDISGVATWTDVAAGMYHIIAQKQAGSLLLASYAHLQINATGIKDTAIALLPVTPVNTLKVTVNDTAGGIVADAMVFIYTSNVVAQLDTLRAAATYTVTTTAAGTASQTNIPSATYYLYGRKIISSDTLAGTGSIFVPATGAVTIPLRIK